MCSVRASHLRVDFTSFNESKKGFTGKPLLGGFFLTGLAGNCLTADEQAAKHEDKSERLQLQRRLAAIEVNKLDKIIDLLEKRLPPN